MVSFLLATLGPSTAFARSVFLNGVDITDLRDKTFDNATVYIDTNGDVHINAPKYKVKVIDNSSNVAPPVQSQSAPVQPEALGGPNPNLSGHYYIAVNPSPNGNAQYDFVLTVNGVERKTIKADSSQVIMEISIWLHYGENQVSLSAKKKIGTGRKSFSPADQASVVVGKGHEVNKIVKIDAVYINLEVNASQTADRTENYTIDAR
jgi:hypothetical protein